MEKLSFGIFNQAALPKTTIKRVVGGAGTAGGSKNVNVGHDSSASVSWTSDTSNGNGSTTLHGYSRTGDDSQ
jgi:hypothetical protein